MGELFERVCAEATLFDAWRRVEHKGARGGIDQVTIAAFRQRLNDNLEQLRADLCAGRYVPEPFQKIEIPKADDPGETRPLQMPTVRDKIAQEAVRSVIAPILEKTFADCSYAYRPGKGPQKAIRRVEHYLSTKKHWMADADIDRFFDTMDQRLTLEEVQKHITEPELVRLLALWMKMGAVDTRGRWVDPVSGIAQGSVISPLLSNVYLTPFDAYLTQKGHALVRYADNFLLLAFSSEAAAQALEDARAFLQQRLRLRLNDHPRPIASLASGFVFLGIYFRGELRRIAHSKIDQMKAEIRRFWQRYASAPVPRLVTELNESILGWQRYYGMVQPHQQFQELDGSIAEGLARALAMRMNTGATVRNTDLYEHLKELAFLRHMPQGERQGAVWQIVRRARVIHEGMQNGGSPGTPSTSPRESPAAAPRPAQDTPTTVAPTAALPVTIKSPEQQVAQAVRTQKRRYLRQAAQGAELVITEPGVFLGKTSRRVVVKKQRRVIMEMPLKQLRHIIIATPGVTLSSAVIAFCAQGNVPMDFLTPRGEPLARLCTPLDTLGNTGLEQLRAVHDGSGLRLAQTIVHGKLRNQLNLVKY